MDKNIESFKSYIDSSSNVLLVFPHIINADVCASIGLMYKLLTESYTKKVDIAASRAIPARFHELLQVCGVDVAKINTSIKPVSYVIHVNDAKETIDVSWAKKNNEVELVLTPESQDIDFDKISFSREGGIYDLVIVFNAGKLNDLGRIYSEYAKLYSRFKIVSISYEQNKEEYADYELYESKSSTLSEVMYKLMNHLNQAITKNTAQVIAEGILGSTFGLHKVYKSQTFQVVSELTSKYGISVANINSKYFYSASKQELRLKQKLIQNVKFEDTKKVIYSTLSSADFAELGMIPQNIDGSDYLPFNVCKDYKVAFLAYEDNSHTTVLLHSNTKDFDLNLILKQLKGYGNKRYGVLILEGNAQNAASQILSVLDGETPVQEKHEDKPVAQVPPVKEAKQYDEVLERPIVTPQKVETSGQQIYENQSAQLPKAPEPQVMSPFQKASGYVIDDTLPQPMPSENGYSQSNKLFQKADTL